jgi:hypothetical protein
MATKSWLLALAMLLIGVLYITSTSTADKIRKRASREEQFEIAHATGRKFGAQSGQAAAQFENPPPQLNSGKDSSQEHDEPVDSVGTSLKSTQNVADTRSNLEKDEVKPASVTMNKQAEISKEASAATPMEKSHSPAEKKIPADAAQEQGEGKIGNDVTEEKDVPADVGNETVCDPETLRVVQMTYQGAEYKLSVHDAEQDNVISKTLLEGSGKYGSVTEVCFILVYV